MNFIQDNILFIKNRYFDGGDFVCQKCNKVFDFYQMDGHHLPNYPKTKDPTFYIRRVSKFYNDPNTLKEFDNLVWLCSHCHTLEHYGEDTKYSETSKYRNAKYLDEHIEYLINKFGGSCSLCGIKLGRRTINYHHIDPKTKVKDISQMIGRYKLSVIEEEVVKCLVCCSNCHRKIHHDNPNLTRYDKIIREESFKKSIVGKKKYNSDRGCSVDGCNGKHVGKGFCKKHITGIQQGYYDDNGLPLNVYPIICKVKGCSVKCYAKGFCRSHYKSYNDSKTIDFDGNPVSLRCKVFKNMQPERLI